MTFKWKDYRIKGRDRLKTMTLDAGEFIRRFLLHVLPSGFHRIFRTPPGRTAKYLTTLNCDVWVCVLACIPIAPNRGNFPDREPQGHHENMGKLDAKKLRGLLAKKPGRHPDGGGLFFKTAGLGRAYWTMRYTFNGRGHETSLGPFPELGLDEARLRHLALMKQLKIDKTNPLGDRNAKGVVVASGVPTFGAMAIKHIEAHKGSWRSSKHERQYASTLDTYCKSIWDMPVDAVDTQAVLACLSPIWSEKPETASRIRARIEAVLASAAVDGWIPEDRPNAARWKNWLDRKLPNPRKVGKPRGHHAAMDYRELPAFMARLSEIDTAAARALRLTILCATRTSETLNAVWSEVSFADKVWRIPAARMKMKVEHNVPLSDAALDILRVQYETCRPNNVYVFPGRPMRPLSQMSMAMLLRRMKVPVTTHGFRSSARSWMADQGVAFELAEAALAHTVGNAVVQAYQRSSMLERRRPVLAAWAQFVTSSDASNVIPIRALAV